MEVIGWFFFDLLMLGYVEDFKTGLSFRIPGGQAWAIYVEVCVSVSVSVCVLSITLLPLYHTYMYRFPLLTSA